MTALVLQPDLLLGRGSCSSLSPPSPWDCSRSPLPPQSPPSCCQLQSAGTESPSRCFSSQHCSAGTGLFLTTSVAEAASFGRGQGRKLEGALIVWAFFMGCIAFPRQQKNPIGVFYSLCLIPNACHAQQCCSFIAI